MPSNIELLLNISCIHYKNSVLGRIFFKQELIESDFRDFENAISQKIIGLFLG